MAHDEIIPFSTQKLSFLPNDDQEWMVHDLHELRFDPNNPERFGIVVQMVRLPGRDIKGSDFANAKLEARRIFIPFSSFAYFGVGNIFQRGRMIERAHSYKDVYKTIFKPRFLADGRFGRFGPNMPVGIQENFSYPIDQPLPRQLHHKVPILKGRDGNEAAYLFMWEIIRFYLAGFSRLSEALIIRHAFPEIDQPPLYNEDESGLDGRTYVLSPTIAFADRATATQLAIILAHSDISNLVVEFSKYLRLAHSQGVDLVPRITMPSGAEALHLAVRKIGIIDPEGNKARGKFYGQILSDGRELAFDKLIIRDPRERLIYVGPDREKSNPPVPPEPTPSGTDETLQWPDDPNNLHGGDPSIGEKEEVSSTFTIDHHFTGLKQVPVKVKRSTVTVERGRSSRKDESDSKKRKKKFKKQYTNSGGAPVKGLWRFRSKLTPDQDRLGTGQKLFLPVDVVPFDVVPVKSVKIDARIQTTLDANQRLRRKSLLRRSSLPKYGPAEAMRLKIDLNSSLRMREIVFGFITVAGRHGVWVEIIRMGETAISLGLILRRDGQKIGPTGVVRILEHYSRKVSLRGAEQRDERDSHIGVWPVFRDYDDIVGDRITHNSPNNIAYYLANTIDEKFREMSLIAAKSSL